MKHFKKLLVVVMAIAITMAMGATAFAQNVDSEKGGNGSITIKNAAKGEKYSVVKIFDAKVGANDEISYQGTIPDSLKAFFEKDNTGNILKKENVDEDALLTAVKAYAATLSKTAEATSDGSTLTFTNLPYGYYAVNSSQGAAVTIDSTNPDKVVEDKNIKEPDATKTVDKESYSIGDTITYTATFDTVNFMDADHKVTKYVISDTLPEFLSDVNVESITVGGTAITTQQFNNKKITIDWVDANGDSLYNNGAQIVIVYTAKLTSTVNIDTANTNTVTIKPYVKDSNGDEQPWSEDWSDDAEVKTYAAALKKIDESGDALTGAQFTIKGLVVEGSAGEYTVVSYNPSSNTQSATLDTNSDGILYIVGLASDAQLEVTETKAPDGYNKLDNSITVTPQLLTTAIYKTSGKIYYDAKGNVVSSEQTATSNQTVEKNLSDLNAQAVQVVNKAGSTLPSTGGIGTTIFYVLGALLVIGCGIFLVARRRASKDEE